MKYVLIVMILVCVRVIYRIFTGPNRDKQGQPLFEIGPLEKEKSERQKPEQV